MKLIVRVLVTISVFFLFKSYSDTFLSGWIGLGTAKIIDDIITIKWK